MRRTKKEPMTEDDEALLTAQKAAFEQAARMDKTAELKELMREPYVKEASYDCSKALYTIKLEDGSIYESADGEAWYKPASTVRIFRPWTLPQADKEDIIGHPNHYCEGRKFEPKDVIRDWDLNFNLGNAVKYISRNGRKDGNSALQDLKKARQYLDFEIEYLEKEQK